MNTSALVKSYDAFITHEHGATAISVMVAMMVSLILATWMTGVISIMVASQSILVPYFITTGLLDLRQGKKLSALMYLVFTVCGAGIITMAFLGA